MKNTKSLNTKKNIHLEFDIKRAVVEPDDDDSTTFIKNVLELNKKSPKDAEDLLMGKWFLSGTGVMVMLTQLYFLIMTIVSIFSTREEIQS